MQVYWNIIIFFFFSFLMCFDRVQSKWRVPSPFTWCYSRNSYCLRLQLPASTHFFWCRYCWPISNHCDGISAAANTFFSVQSRCHIGIAIVSLSPLVPSMAMQLSHVEYGMLWPVKKQQEAFHFCTNFVFSPILNTTNSNEPRFQFVSVVRHVFFIG